MKKNWLRPVAALTAAVCLAAGLVGCGGKKSAAAWFSCTAAEGDPDVGTFQYGLSADVTEYGLVEEVWHKGEEFSTRLVRQGSVDELGGAEGSFSLAVSPTVFDGVCEGLGWKLALNGGEVESYSVTLPEESYGETAVSLLSTGDGEKLEVQDADGRALLWAAELSNEGLTGLTCEKLEADPGQTAEADTLVLLYFALSVPASVDDDAPGGQDEPAGDSADLDAAVDQATVDHFAPDYSGDGLMTASHVTLHTETGADGQVTVYAWVMFRQYNWISASYGLDDAPDGMREGTSLPAAITLTSTESGYELTDYWAAQGDWGEGVKENFPAKAAELALEGPADGLIDSCQAQALALWQKQTGETEPWVQFLAVVTEVDGDWLVVRPMGAEEQLGEVLQLWVYAPESNYDEGRGLNIVFSGHIDEQEPDRPRIIPIDVRTAQ